MLDVYEVLREKEIAIAQIRREVEALRLVCQMLEKEGDSIPDTFEPSPEIKDERRESTNVVALDSERQAVLASIRALLAEAEPTDPPKEFRSVVVQFRHGALSASRALLKRVSIAVYWNEGRNTMPFGTSSNASGAMLPEMFRRL